MEGAGAPKIPEAEKRQQDRASLAIIVITLDPEVYWRADAFRLIGLALNPPFVHLAHPNITVNTLAVGKAPALTVLQLMLRRFSSPGQVKGIIHKNYFWASLRFLIVMRIGRADFWVLILSPGTLTHGATLDLDSRRQGRGHLAQF